MFGVQVYYIVDVIMVEDCVVGEWLVKIEDVNLEVKCGDKFLYGELKIVGDMILQVVSKFQCGFIVGNFYQYQLLGKYDVVIVDLGEEDIELGIVMGIYQQGLIIIDGDEFKYFSESKVVMSMFDDGFIVEQFVLKVGELIIFSMFMYVSYGIIICVVDIVKIGNIVV